MLWKRLWIYIWAVYRYIDNEDGNSEDWYLEWSKKINDLELKKNNYLFFELENEDHLDQNNLIKSNKEALSIEKRKRVRKQKRPTTYQEWVEEEVNALLLADHGSKRILNMLESLNIEEEIQISRREVSLASLSKRERLLRRLRLLETFKSTKTDPSWMILTVLPILPPALRPVFELPNGTYMSSEFNEHYRRIVMIMITMTRMMRREMICLINIS